MARQLYQAVTIVIVFRHAKCTGFITPTVVLRTWLHKRRLHRRFTAKTISDASRGFRISSHCHGFYLQAPSAIAREFLGGLCSPLDSAKSESQVHREQIRGSDLRGVILEGKGRIERRSRQAGPCRVRGGGFRMKKDDKRR